MQTSFVHDPPLKEVVLSAGAINSPQILLLSGIGPKWHLDELEIPVRADLSVGENLQDHYGSGGLAFTIEEPVSLQKGSILTWRPQFWTTLVLLYTELRPVGLEVVWDFCLGMRARE